MININTKPIIAGPIENPVSDGGDDVDVDDGDRDVIWLHSFLVVPQVVVSRRSEEVWIHASFIKVSTDLDNTIS